MGPQQRKQIVVFNSRRLVISVFGENETNESVTLHHDILGAFSNVFSLLSEKKWSFTMLFCLVLNTVQNTVLNWFWL